MRNDQVEELAADIAGAVAYAVLTSASSLIDQHTARFLSGVASSAATEAARQAVARYTALRIEADTAHVKDLRTR
jgi:CelD/BcsL family acetyltransferase involved in cellulose biosynthesis